MPLEMFKRKTYASVMPMATAPMVLMSVAVTPYSYQRSGHALGVSAIYSLTNPSTFGLISIRM